MFFPLKETAYICFFTTLTVPVYPTAANAEIPLPIRPMAVENIGTFCCTGTVITTNSKKHFFAIEDMDRRHHWLFSSKSFGVSRGDHVAVSGEQVRYDNGDIHESVRQVIHLGKRSLPPPEKTSIAELVKRDSISNTVIAEGTLVLIRRDEIDASFIQFFVKDDASILCASLTIGTNNPPTASIPLGARVRLTGNMMPISGGARKRVDKHLLLNEIDGIEIIAVPSGNIFNSPELNLDSPCSQEQSARMDLHRFTGIVLAAWNDNQIMIEGKGFRRIKATLAMPEERPSAGEMVTVAGFPDADPYGVNLVYARCKRDPEQAQASILKPAFTTLRQLFTDESGRPRINGYSHGRLLRISGTVLDIQPSMSLFSLNSDEITTPIDCTASPDAIDILEKNSKVEITVLAVLETESWRENIALPQTLGLKLILRSAQDINVISCPPWWTPARLTAAIITLLFAIVFIITTNRIINRIMMRRKISERTRLAVELHDSLSQTLAGVACQIAAGQGAVLEDPQAAKDLLKTAERMLKSSRTELKNCLFDLRSDTVDDPDFTRAIEKTLTVLKAQADITIRFNVPRQLLTDASAHAVLCIIRELVSNAIRHGAATRIRIAGTVEGRNVLFSVQDNGCGFDPKRRPGPRDGHFGLAGIHERLAAINGSFSIKSKPGSTRISANIVLP